MAACIFSRPLRLHLKDKTKVIRLHLQPLHIWLGCCVYSIDLLVMLWIYIRLSPRTSSYLHSPALTSASHLSHISIISKYNADIQSLDSKTAGTPRHTKSCRMWIQNEALVMHGCAEWHNTAVLLCLQTVLPSDIVVLSRGALVSDPHILGETEEDLCI